MPLGSFMLACNPLCVCYNYRWYQWTGIWWSDLTVWPLFKKCQMSFCPYIRNSLTFIGCLSSHLQISVSSSFNLKVSFQTLIIKEGQNELPTYIWRRTKYFSYRFLQKTFCHFWNRFHVKRNFQMKLKCSFWKD